MNTITHHKTPEQMVEAIFALDLDPIKLKLMDKEEGQGWSRAQADHYELEYKRFLALLARFPDEVIAPSSSVDKVWHAHILDTMKYAEDCQDIFGYFLHHFPYFGMRGEEDAANLRQAADTMKQLYEQEFGAAAQSANSAYCGAAKPDASAHCGAAKSDATAYCAAAKPVETSAYCAVAKPVEATAHCGAAKSDATAYCAAAKPDETSAYCAAAKPVEATAYCAAAKPVETSAYCGAAKEAASAAYCGAAAAPAHCGAAKEAQSAYCGAAKGADKTAYCGVVAGLGRPKLEPAEALA